MTRKLTYIINAIDYGGAEIGMIRLLSGLDESAFDVTVVTLKGADPTLEADLPAHVRLMELQLDTGPTIGTVRSLLGAVRRADVLVGSLYPSIVVGSVLATITRVPGVYTWKHNTSEGSGLTTALNKLSFRLSDAVLVDSKATWELVSQWGVSEERIKKLPISGIDLDEYPDVNHWGTGSRIGTVGSLILQKGYPELLACAERMPEYEFHVVGEGPLADELERGPENVIVHGTVSQDELYALWGSFDVYFQPSRWEGLCITAIEAMASGLPVVASAVDGLTESVVDGETGFLLEQGDVDGYCSKLRELAADPELREKFGTAGRTRVAEAYSVDALVDGFREVTAERSS